MAVLQEHIGRLSPTVDVAFTKPPQVHVVAGKTHLSTPLVDKSVYLPQVSLRKPRSSAPSGALAKKWPTP